MVKDIHAAIFVAMHNLNISIFQRFKSFLFLRIAYRLKNKLKSIVHVNLKIFLLFNLLFKHFNTLPPTGNPKMYSSNITPEIVNFNNLCKFSTSLNLDSRLEIVDLLFYDICNY